MIAAAHGREMLSGRTLPAGLLRPEVAKILLATRVREMLGERETLLLAMGASA